MDPNAGGVRSPDLFTQFSVHQGEAGRFPRLAPVGGSVFGQDQCPVRLPVVRNTVLQLC